MSEKLIKPYEISVWEDKLIQDGNEYKFIEKKLAVIGSDTMAGLNKVYNPVFHKKANGEKTLSFSLKYKYFDPYLGNDSVINPFVSLLTNERKVKLHYDNQWYEFIVKEHTESSDGYEWTYTCNDAFVLELSKNGYNLTFDNELNNNQGTAAELARKVLENTDWQLGQSDLFRQLIEEPIYKATLVSTSGITIINTDNTSETVSSGTSIYLFYTYIKNKNGKYVQFIIRDNNRHYIIDDKNVITDTNFRIETELEYKTVNNVTGFYLDNNLIISIGDIETKYQAYRLAYNQLTTYDPVMQRTVDRFKIEGDDREVYRYIDYVYTTSNVVLNYITNGDNFNVLEDGTLQGWNPYVDFTGMEQQDAKIDKLELVTKPELGKGKLLADISTLSQIEGFLKIKFKAAYDNGKNAVYNSGFENNTSSIQSISQGDEFVFRWRAGQRDSNIPEYEYALTTDTEVKSDKTYYVRTGSAEPYTYTEVTPIGTENPSGQGWYEEVKSSISDVDCLVATPNLRAVVARYTQDEPNRWTYYYRHINTDDIVLEFDLAQGQSTPEILNNIIEGGILQDYYVLTTDKEIDNTKTYYTYDAETEVYTAVANPVLADINEYYELRKQYVIDDVVQTPSTKYIYNNSTDNKNYVWNGISGDFEELENDYSNYLPYYYLTAKATKALTNATLKDPTQKYGIFIYTNDSVSSQKPFYIQDIQLTRLIRDANDEPIIMGNIPTATSVSTEYYYLKPEDGAVAEDVIMYTTLEELKNSEGISTDVVALYNENSEKNLTISASKSNCFDILQTIAETFECWIDLEVNHNPDTGYITYVDNIPQKYVYLREYAGDKQYAGFKYGINLQSIERDINSTEFVTKLIVDQSQSEYVDEGYVSIASAPSNISGESYILNFDYYYNQGLLNREEAEADRLRFTTRLANINSEIKKKEVQRKDLEASLTALGSKRNVYTELIDTAKEKKTQGLAEFEELTNRTYDEYREQQDTAVSYDEDYYVPTPDTTIKQGKNYYTYDDQERVIELVSTPAANPHEAGYYELLMDLTEEDTVFDLIGQIYVTSATINNYSGILTNIEQEYWEKRRQLRGLETYNVKIWISVDELEQYHVYVELNDYLPGFSFTIAGVSYESTVSVKYFNLEFANIDDLVIDFIPPSDYEMEEVSYTINPNIVKTISITPIEEQKGLESDLEKLYEEKEETVKDFNNKYSRFIQEGTWNSTDYIDSELYYLDALQVSNTSAQPTVSYTINVVEISQLEGFEWYLFDAGDKSYVEDTEFFGWANINTGTEEEPNYILTPAREEVIVSEVEWHLEEPDKNVITVQNYKTRFEDFFQRVNATVQTVQYNEATYAKISSLVDANGTINQDVLLESLNNINGREYNLTSNGSIVVQDDIILVQNLTNPANHVIINSEGIRVSSDGGENYTTVIDGQGINIGAVYTGSLNTNEIIIGNKNYPSFRWDKAGISAYHVDESDVPDQYILTEDTEVVVGKIYYILVRSGYRPVEDPTGNPKEQGWYELITENFTDLKTFVRFDEYGLYGIKNAEKFKAQQLSDITENAHFAVTWDGFFIKNSYADGGRVSITSDNDFQVTKKVNNVEQEVIKIGMLEERVGGNLYGMRIKGTDNTDAFVADSNGNLSITGTINALDGNFSDLVTVGKNTEETTDYIKIDGASASISSSNYNVEPSTSATQGWIINKNGDAVFNNIIARGSIKTAVFEYAEIQAVGGIFIFRPSSTIRSAAVDGNNLILTVEKQHLFSVDDWVKISNYTTDGSEPDASYTLQENGLTHVYRVSAVNNRNVTLENAAAMVEGNNKIVDIEDLFGGALVSMGHYESGIDSNNYGIGINSSDNTVNLARRAISLFETEIKPNAQDGIRVKYNYRGILGTLPPMSNGVDTSIYNHMQGTQGIYTDNMYIGDENQYLVFYNDGNNKKLEIRANEILFKKNGEYKNVADAVDATQGGHFIFKGSNTIRYILTEDTEVDPNKIYYIYDDISGEYVETQLDPTDNPSELDCYEQFISTHAGAGVVQNDISDPALWGYNTWIGSNGIQLRTGEEAYAILNANGLLLNKGGIKAGTPGESEFIYLSTDNFNDTITGQTQGTIPIDNYVKTNWREIIGRNFAVDEDGNLYAKSAKIDGDIVASSLTINSGGTTYNGIDALNVSGYELVIEVDSTNLSYAVLYPHLYLNGSEVTGTFRSAAGTTFDNNEVYYNSNYVIVTNPVAADIDNYYISNVDYRKFIWYINDSSSGQASTHAAKGSIQANYSDRARVTYAFDDGGTEGAQEAVTITVDPSKYITRIDDSGIKIHPEVWDNNSQYVQIDGNGFAVWDNNKQIAQYGEEATIGDRSGFHIGITANYNNTGKPRLSFYRDENHEVAYISENKLYITQSVVLQQMDVGRLTGEVDTATEEVGKGLWSWKVHEVNGKNNLYLKWLG